MYHWPDMMRLELLIQHGGIFLDHDAYVFRSLDELRRCCPPAESRVGNTGCRPSPVVAGFEQAPPTLRKLNPGVLLAERRSRFLRMCRAAWQNYSTLWDYNCCEVRGCKCVCATGPEEFTKSRIPPCKSPIHASPLAGVVQAARSTQRDEDSPTGGHRATAALPDKNGVRQAPQKGSGRPRHRSFQIVAPTRFTPIRRHGRYCAPRD